MSLFNKIKTLVEDLDHYLFVETVSCDWFTKDDEILWVDSNSDVYSAEFNQGALSRDDSVVINIDNGCGETISMVFLKDKKISEDEFYDKYEEFM